MCPKSNSRTNGTGAKGTGKDNSAFPGGFSIRLFVYCGEGHRSLDALTVVEICQLLGGIFEDIELIGTGKRAWGMKRPLITSKQSTGVHECKHFPGRSSIWLFVYCGEGHRSLDRLPKCRLDYSRERGSEFVRCSVCKKRQLGFFPLLLSLLFLTINTPLFTFYF